MASGGTGGALSRETVTSLLRIGVSGSLSLVDRVIEILEREEGDAWLGNAVEAMGEDARRVGRGERVGLTALRAMKDDAKARVGAARDQDAALRGTLEYLIAVAGALVEDNAFISTHTRDEIEGTMTELADLAPKEWAGVFRTAAERLGET